MAMTPSAGASLRGSEGKLLTFRTLQSLSVMKILLGLLLIGSSVGKAKAAVVTAFLFGDSLADAGTNNFNLNPLIPKANFPPYGESYFSPPTGRFSNGRLVVDFLAQSLNLPLPSPYKQLNPILHGTDFASGGSGILDATNILEGVTPLSVQVFQFQTVALSLPLFFGQATATSTLRNSLYGFTSGSNDLLVYFTNPLLQLLINQSAYINNMVSTLAANIQKVIDAGGRKIFVSGLAPIGCVPIALAAEALLKGIFTTPTGPFPCVDKFNQAAQQFNTLLLQRVNAFNAGGKAFVVYGNAYKALSDVLTNAAALGFTDTTSACCGGGIFNGITRCGRGSYSLCPNVNDHVFFDNIHPTERVYQIVANQFLYGGQDVVFPINIAQLVQLP